MRTRAILGLLAVTVGVTAGAVSPAGADTGGAASGGSAAPITPSAAPNPPADLSLTRAVNGEAAVQALGASLPAAAAAAGVTPSELRTQLRSDSDLWVDRTGQPTYVDTEFADPPSSAAPAAEAAAHPYSETFTLHSRPQSTKTLYLDFDGFDVGSSWGTPFTASPFDSDGDPTTFSEHEQDIIQSVWATIAEDYRVFDVDVTTEEPTATELARADLADQEYGIRLTITDTDTIASTCNCGGIAHLGVFPNGNGDTAFVFIRGTGAIAKYIAEAGSHELGHTLGLKHDGNSKSGYDLGHANWAPIMGAGYYKPVSQWSKGEYKTANNHEDDFAVIQAHGLNLLTDDVGDTTAAASFVGATFPVDTDGMITTAKDVDLYKFKAGAGALTVTATVAAESPDLDVALEVLDSAGKSVVKANPASGMTSASEATGLDATLTTTLTKGGTYFVKVDGVGNGTGVTGYTDYGSVGGYHLTIDGPSGASVPNVVPVPKLTAPTTVGAPGAAAFSSLGSTDADGVVATTSWNFGDGSDAATGTDVTHSYAAAGTYTVTMTVTDNSGGTATKTAKVTALPVVRVDFVAIEKVTSPKLAATSTIKAVDAAGAAVSGATVGVTFSYGTKSVTGTGKTGADGTVVIKGPSAASGTEVTVTVTKITATGKAFNPGGDGNTAKVTL